MNDLPQRGVPFGVAGWGWLSPPGRMSGIVHLRRAYLLSADESGVTVVDAVTGWGGRLKAPIRFFGSSGGAA